MGTIVHTILILSVSTLISFSSSLIEIFYLTYSNFVSFRYILILMNYYEMHNGTDIVIWILINSLIILTLVIISIDNFHSKVAFISCFFMFLTEISIIISS